MCTSTACGEQFPLIIIPNAVIVRQTSHAHTPMFITNADHLDDFDLQTLGPDTIIITSIQQDTLPIF
jgi:hypothetical protein